MRVSRAARIFSKTRSSIGLARPVLASFTPAITRHFASSRDSQFEEEYSPRFESQVGVSKSYTNITTEKIEEFLLRQKVVYKARSNGQIVIKECPFCPRPHQNKVSNMWTLNLKENSGAFLCFRCNAHGSWYDFVRALMGGSINFDNKTRLVHSTDPREAASLEEEARLRAEKTASVLEESTSMYSALLETVKQLSQLESGELETVNHSATITNMSSLKYLIGTQTLEERHLSIETLKAYRIGIGEEMFKNEEGALERVPIVNYPLYKPTAKKNKKASDVTVLDTVDYDCVRSKMRGIGKSLKHFQRFKPSGGHFGVFGLHLMKPNSKVTNFNQDCRNHRRRV